MRLRLHGSLAECDQATRRLAEAFDVVAISGPYPDRGPSVLVRVYVEIRLDPGPGTSASSTGQAGPGQPRPRELP